MQKLFSSLSAAVQKSSIRNPFSSKMYVEACTFYRQVTRQGWFECKPGQTYVLNVCCTINSGCSGCGWCGCGVCSEVVGSYCR